MTVHVLMTAASDGGVWTYACELVGALAAHDVRVTLATMGAPLARARAQAAARLPNLDVVESTYALEWTPDPWRDVDAAGDWLQAIAARVRPDVVHVNGYAHAALAFGVPVVAVAHACVATWFRAVRGTEAGPAWAEHRARTARGLTAAHAIAAPTAAILRAVLEAHGVRRDGHVIANGRAAAIAKPPAKEPFVLAAGRLGDEAKGLDTLAAAAPHASWPIYVAGPTRRPGTDDAVTAPGVQPLGELAPEALADRMGRAAIYARPARYEPFGLSILDAALAGCALVIGDLATLREVWHDDAAFVPPGDPDALAFTLRMLARDPLRRGALAACARSRSLALTPARMGAAYRALYDHVRGRAAACEECA